MWAENSAAAIGLSLSPVRRSKAAVQLIDLSDLLRRRRYRTKPWLMQLFALHPVAASEQLAIFTHMLTVI
jgi:hypothetical protein